MSHDQEQHKWDSVCLVLKWQNCSRRCEERERWQFWNGHTDISWNPRYMSSHFRDRKTDTRSVATVPWLFSLKRADVGLKPGHLILKHNKGTRWDSWEMVQEWGMRHAWMRAWPLLSEGNPTQRVFYESSSDCPKQHFYSWEQTSERNGLMQ